MTTAPSTVRGEVRRLVEFTPPPPPMTPRPWRTTASHGAAERSQFDLTAAEGIRYPRAERIAPSVDRVDHALTRHVLASACSEVRIEWTYGDGTGAAPALAGVDMSPARAAEFAGAWDTYAPG